LWIQAGAKTRGAPEFKMRITAWWQRGIVYEIYPRSFQDSNNDGVGDLAGILARLDYLAALGVDALWIAPIFPSPMADFGYDVADYCDIDPIFGTLADFDRLLAAAHQRGLKIILDFVPNHTSDRHPWFLESRSARDNPKRDWYLWRDPAPDGGPPNNWLSNFGGPAWEWDAATRQYYCHSFLKEQPDVNWRNPELRHAMLAVLRFWMDRGVDGFRVDVLWLLIKDELFRDNPLNPGYQPGSPSTHRFLSVYNADRPEIHDLVAQIRSVIDSYPERVLIGEIYLPYSQLVAYYGKELRGANLPFNFQLILCAWSAGRIAEIIREYEAALPPGAWPNWVLGNHDQARIATRIGAEQARVAAMLLLTLRGTPTIYYGEEIGMTNVPVLPEEVQDPAEKNEPGLGLGRDPERSPMPWDNAPQAGFSNGRPWLRLGQDYLAHNVATLSQRRDSILNLYRTLIGIRRSNEALVSAPIINVVAEGQVLRYERKDDYQHFAIVLNMGHDPQDVAVEQGRILASTFLDREGERAEGSITLRPAEGLIVSLEKARV
jgi:alpha-glucosidase